MEEHPLLRANEMMAFVAKIMESLVEKRIKHQRAGHEKSKFRLQQEIQKMAGDKRDGIIALCYLRSEYITQNHNFYMAWYDKEIFVEEEPQFKFIDMSGFMKGIEEDFEVINREIRKKYIRVTAGEQEYLCERYMDKLYKEFEAVLRDTIHEIEKKTGIALYYGGYMEEQTLIGYI